MKVFVIAGEPSGDRLGAAMMDGFGACAADVEFAGVGGPLMERAGLRSIFPMQEISVMGIGEILSQYRHLKRRIRETAEAVIAARPDVLITIDIPEFSLRVARLVKARRPDLRVVHYVAPTVWAWRPGRAARMAAYVDHVLALFPFEPPYMEAAGMDCDFVGHPVVSEPQATEEEALVFRAGARVKPNEKLVMVLPGSRRSEVTRLLPVFEDVILRLRALGPGIKVVIPTTANVAPLVKSATEGWAVRPLVLDGGSNGGAAPLQQKRAAFRAADVALAASGTVSLELAAAGTPMVIAYDMSWLSRQIIGRMLKTDTVTLVNLVSETRAVPEFIGAQCRAENIAPALMSVLENPDSQADAMELTMDRLGRGGQAPGLRAAQAVLRGIGRAV